MNLPQAIERLKNSAPFRQNLTTWRTLPPRPAEYGAFPEKLDPRLLAGREERHMGAHTKPDLSEYASRLISFKARRIVGHYGFIRSDSLDLEQDLAVHLIEQMDRYDPNRGGQKTFVDRIVNHRLISILRQRIAQR
ncbi:MAG: hypothetical protein IIB38_17220, partial [Candidatus Hydrogenedentes bacterium]|nr:hypothetical protein [Candidatus Hydrogenedentota bacterium]